MEPTSKPARPFLPDRVAGGVMLLGFAGITLAWLWSTWHLSTLYPGQAGRTPMLPTALGYLSAFLGFAPKAWYAFGVYRSQGWAFVIAFLISAQNGVQFIDAYSNYRPGLQEQASFAFVLLTFLYCGIRLGGKWGPRIALLLPARDASRFVD